MYSLHQKKTWLDPSQSKVIVAWFILEKKFSTKKCWSEGGLADHGLRHAMPRKDIFYRQPWITEMISLSKNPRSHDKLKERYKHKILQAHLMGRQLTFWSFHDNIMNSTKLNYKKKIQITLITVPLVSTSSEMTRQTTVA